MNSRVRFLEAILRWLRWWGLPVAAISAGIAGGLLVYDILPKEYEAHTTILVAPPQIPRSYVRSTVSEDMAVRLRSLQEAVLSRPYMEQIVQKVLGIDADDPDFEGAIRSIRSRVVVELKEYDRRRGTGLFEIRCRDEDPVRVARLVNLLADLYIRENVRLRTEQASGTADTLYRLAEEVRAELDKKEKAMADFRARHLYELEENLPSNLHLLETRRSELESVERELARAQDHLRLLRMQQETGAATVEGGPARDPLLERRQQLEAEIASLRSRYTEANPLLRARLEELAEVKRALERRRKRADQAPSTDPLALEIEQTRAEIARLERERDRLRGEIELYRKRIEATPRITQQLKELAKGYEALKERYEKYRGDYEEARGSLRIEEERRSSQFEIIERAVPARKPVRPRLPVVLAGAGTAIFLGLNGPLLAWLLLVPVAYSRRGVEEVTGLPVLASVPVIPGGGETREKILRLVVNLALSALGIAVLAFRVAGHFPGGSP